MFNGIITTAMRYVGDQKEKVGSLIIDTRKLDGMMNPYQTVVEVGPHENVLKPGDVVYINFSRYAKSRHVPGKIEDNVQSDNLSYAYEIPSVNINGIDHLMIQGNDVMYFMRPSEGDIVIDDGGLLQ